MTAQGIFDPAMQANLQEKFDTVLACLRKQGRPSINADGACLYRGPDGLKCALGHLIPDATYKPWFEGTGPEGCDKSVARAAGLDPYDHRQVSFAARLQAAHDTPAHNARCVTNGVRWDKEFEDHMRLVARDFSLKYTPPKESE